METCRICLLNGVYKVNSKNPCDFERFLLLIGYKTSRCLEHPSSGEHPKAFVNTNLASRRMSENVD